jgi:hypothetical protein
MNTYFVWLIEKKTETKWNFFYLENKTILLKQSMDANLNDGNGNSIISNTLTSGSLCVAISRIPCQLNHLRRCIFVYGIILYCFE